MYNLRFPKRYSPVIIPKTCLVVIATLATAVSAHASIHIQPGEYIRLTDGLGGRGGVFYAHEVGAPQDTFATFCVEVSETVSLPGTYFVENLGLVANKTGNNLTNLAGWIYSDYLDGVLPGQPASTATNAQKIKYNNSVQLAIWSQVQSAPPGDFTSYITGGSTNYDLALVGTILSTTASSHPGGGHGVQIMNLRTSSAINAGYVQDQLVRNAPEFTSFVTWAMLLALGTVLVHRRNFAFIAE